MTLKFSQQMEFFTEEERLAFAESITKVVGIIAKRGFSYPKTYDKDIINFTVLK